MLSFWCANRRKFKAWFRSTPFTRSVQSGLLASTLSIKVMIEASLRTLTSLEAGTLEWTYPGLQPCRHFASVKIKILQTSLSWTCLVAPAHEGNPLTLMSWLKMTVRNQELAFLAITAKPTSKSSIGDPNTVLALASLDPKSHLFRFFHRKVPQIQSWRDNTSSLSDGGATKSSCYPHKSLQ